MNYFDYLSMENYEDTKENFIKYLINIKDYNKEDATRYANLYY